MYTIRGGSADEHALCYVRSVQLMGIMSALDKLIEEGFEPERTILISFGFDEEIGGKRVRPPSPNPAYVSPKVSY